MIRTGQIVRLAVCALAVGGLMACVTTVRMAEAQNTNVVLFYTDDMHWDDLPFFAPPLRWTPGDAATVDKTAHLVRPDLNRLSARLFANPSTGKLRNSGATPPFGSCTGSLDELPVDLAEGGTTCAAFTYTSSAVCASADEKCHPKKGWEGEDVAGPGPGTCGSPAGAICDPATDILPGFGGLARLRETGVMFTRAYANSARCGPARASLFSGRHITRIGFVDNGSELAPEEVTLPEFLKQGCQVPADGPECLDENGAFGPCPCHLDGGCATGGGCYTTGLIGKWHLGGGTGKDPWAQGFDEFVGFGGGSRHYYRRAPLRCSPEQRSFCSADSTSNAHRLCTVDGDCPGGRCDAPTDAYCKGSPGTSCASDDDCATTGPCISGLRGLYIGPEPDFNYCTTEIVSAAPLDGHSMAERSPYCCAPTRIGQKGTYRYPHHLGEEEKQHRKPASATALSTTPLFWLKDGAKPPPSYPAGALPPGFAAGSRLWPCSDSGSTLETGCLYSTRRVRDHARDFIARHADDSNPFFLMVSMHAPHFALVAPKRTMQHYTDIKKQRPKRPLGGANNYWAILEEIDLMVGAVREKLEGLGRPTVVFFTNDHGGPHSGYGVPALRGGKESVTEGGIRTGLFVATVTPTGQTSPLALTAGRRDDEAISGQIDFYPTIAGLAGWSGALQNGQLTVCAAPVDPNAPTCQAADKIRLDGHDLKPMLEGGTVRDVVFASFHGTGKAAVTKAGLYANDGVCAWSGQTNAALVGYQADVRAASCIPCTSTASCTTPQQWCQVLGKVCLSSDSLTCGKKTDPCQCGVAGETCTAPGDHPRCSGGRDCGPGMKCVFVEAPCNSCETGGSWKMRGDVVGGVAQPKEMFEVNTNPEENPGPDPSRSLDCLGQGFTAIENNLKTRLADWSECIADRDNCANADCANPSEAGCHTLP